MTLAAREREAGLAADASGAVLSASAMGAPVYRRMGFVDVGAIRGCVLA